MHGGFTAMNVQERNTKVTQLFFMCKTKSAKLFVPSVENTI